MTYLTVTPWTRVNDQWVTNNVAYGLIPNVITHPMISGSPNSASTRYQADFYDKFAVDIVTETVYNYQYPYVSEKTLRPIACKRMFIIVGAPGTLALLHTKGFKTFSDVIDESYDAITDPSQRWHSLERTIKEFVTKPLDEIKDIVRAKADVLDYNFNVLKNLQAEEIKCLK